MLARTGLAAGFDFGVHPYMLRHACGYKLADEGQDVCDIQYHLGHKNIQNTVRYTQLSEGIRDAVNWQDKKQDFARESIMIFESITVWQAEDYLVRIQSGFFRTCVEAEAFGKQPLLLKRDGCRLVLFGKKTGVELDEAYDENIAVLRLKATAITKATVSDDDYEQVALRIAEFDQVPELASFGLLAYGVNEVTELRVVGHG